MKAVTSTVAANATSETTKMKNPGVLAAVRAVLHGQDLEGYAKACSALGRAAALEIDLSKLMVPVLIIAGSEDKVRPPAMCESLASKLSSSSKVVLKDVHDVGHWSAIEDLCSVGKLIRGFVDEKKE
jgi:pimeloyl-ACP methyl ester carboxylesterase